MEQKLEEDGGTEVKPDGSANEEEPVASLSELFQEMLQLNEHMVCAIAESQVRNELEDAVAYQRALHRNLIEMATFVDMTVGVYAKQDTQSSETASVPSLLEVLRQTKEQQRTKRRIRRRWLDAQVKVKEEEVETARAKERKEKSASTSSTASASVTASSSAPAPSRPDELRSLPTTDNSSDQSSALSSSDQPNATVNTSQVAKKRPRQVKTAELSTSTSHRTHRLIHPDKCTPKIPLFRDNPFMMFPPPLIGVCSACKLLKRTVAECRLEAKHGAPPYFAPQPSMVPWTTSTTRTGPTLKPSRSSPKVKFKRMCVECRLHHQSVHICRVKLKHTAPEWNSAEGKRQAAETKKRDDIAKKKLMPALSPT